MLAVLAAASTPWPWWNRPRLESFNCNFAKRSSEVAIYLPEPDLKGQGCRDSQGVLSS